MLQNSDTLAYVVTKYFIIFSYYYQQPIYLPHLMYRQYTCKITHIIVHSYFCVLNYMLPASR